MPALTEISAYDLYNLTSVSLGDVEGNNASAKGYRPGGCAWLNSWCGPRLMQYVQNRSGSAYVQGALISSAGDTNGLLSVTTSGAAGVNTTRQATTSGLTDSAHAGASVYVVNSVAGAGVAPEGEESVIGSNTTTLIRLDNNAPAFSATITPGDTLDVGSTWNSELSAAGDSGLVVLGVCIGRNGIDANSYGWVTKQGRQPNTLVKASTALTQSDALIADVGRVGPAAGGTATALAQIGTALHVVNSDIVSDKTTVQLALGFGFNPGTTDVSA